MGRQVSSNEHYMAGTVRIGRPTRPNVELTPDLQESLDEALERVTRIKTRAQEGSVFILPSNIIDLPETAITEI
jgi:hypothetical protein